MLAIAHTIISLPFAFFFDTPVAIFVAAFSFHLFSDTLLHWNIYPEVAKKWFYPLAGADVSVALLLAWLLMGSDFFTTPVLLAIFAGNLPDILQGFWGLAGPKRQKHMKWAKPFFDFHDNLQLETKDPVRGLVWQVALVLISIALIQLTR